MGSGCGICTVELCSGERDPLLPPGDLGETLDAHPQRQTLCPCCCSAPQGKGSLCLCHWPKAGQGNARQGTDLSILVLYAELLVSEGTECAEESQSSGWPLSAVPSCCREAGRRYPHDTANRQLFWVAGARGASPFGLPWLPLPKG